jgi:hypothetical protein
MCEIQGTDTIYDGKQIPGILDKSCSVPNYRPNFCEKTGYYVVTLWANWYGYTNDDKLGSVKFFGMKEPQQGSNIIGSVDLQDLGGEIPQESRAPVAKSKGLDSKQIMYIAAILIALLIIVAIIARLRIKRESPRL